MTVANDRYTGEATLLPRALDATARYFGMGEAFFRSAAGGFVSAADDASGGVAMNCFGRIAVNHYLPRWQEDQLEYGEHTDTSLFTFVRRSGPNGLQFFLGDDGDDGDDGEWLDLPYHERLLVVNAGDTAARLSNGHWRAVPHRVGAPESGGVAALAAAAGGATPLTISYFAQPHDDHVLEPLPSLRIEQRLRPQFRPALTSGGLREAKTNNMREG